MQWIFNVSTRQQPATISGARGILPRRNTKINCYDSLTPSPGAAPQGVHWRRLSDVRRWDPLNERQLSLLQCIGDGDDLSGPDGVGQRNSARALQDRGLVDVSRKGGVWRARVTDAGRFYLAHGHHPEQPATQASQSRPPSRAPSPLPRGRDASMAVASDTDGISPTRAAPTPAVKRAEKLMDRLREEGGTLRIETPSESTRASYRRALHAAKQYNLVPAGFHLKYTGRDSGDIVVRLCKDSDPDDADWNRIRLNARRDTTDPTLVFTALENDPASLDVTESCIPRALSLIHALVLQP